MLNLSNGELKIGCTDRTDVCAYAEYSNQNNCIVNNTCTNLTESFAVNSISYSEIENNKIETKEKENDLNYFSKNATFTGTFTLKDPNYIESVKVVVPEKVLWITFSDGFKTKMVRHKDDEFDIEKCLYIALAKKLYKDVCTFEGLLHMSEELTWYKYYEKIVKSGIKKYKEAIKEMQLSEDEEERIAEKKRKSKLKKQKRLERKEKRETERLAKEREEMVDIIADAIKKSKE